MKITLDAHFMNKKEEAHAYLKDQMRFPEYYGSNLDALYDCLTEIADTDVVIMHAGEAKEYYPQIENIFRKAAAVNEGLRISFEEREKECPSDGSAAGIKVVLVHGQNHKGSTCHIARMLADKIGGETKEFFLPRDFDQFCVGCTSCFEKDEKLCPHYEKLRPITEALDEADVIILASPVYVFHAAGAMKAWLDHYGYRWMVHRPEESMFQKQGVCISTAAGAGMRSTNKDMRDSLYFWGVGRIYQYGEAVRAVSYEQVNEKIKDRIDKKTTALARRIISRHGRVRPGWKTKAFFFVMGMVQKKGWNEADVSYWREKGWTGKVRPWK